MILAYAIILYTVALLASILLFAMFHLSLPLFVVVWILLCLIAVGGYCNVKFLVENLGYSMRNNRYFVSKILEYVENAILIAFFLSLSQAAFCFFTHDVLYLVGACGSLYLTYVLSGIRTGIRDFLGVE